jgi:phosphatidylethanolamine-binding protein (PEBP) family uncharacterized protein
MSAILSQVHTRAEPNISLQNVKSYPVLLVMFDPDAPSAKNSYLHWLRLYTSHSEYSDIVPYSPPSPPPNTGRQNNSGKWYHEYIFQLYEHPIVPTVPNSRSKFNSNQHLGELIAEDKFCVSS